MQKALRPTCVFAYGCIPKEKMRKERTRASELDGQRQPAYISTFGEAHPAYIREGSHPSTSEKKKEGS
jgi:hypothetical protein